MADAPEAAGSGPAGPESAGFFQQEVELSARWKLYVGGRLDGSRYQGATFSPRAALIYQPSPSAAWKLLYGSAFRNPSPFEELYADSVSAGSNLALKPEHLQTWEGSYERQLGKSPSLLGDAYYYDLDHWIIRFRWTTASRSFNMLSISAAGFEAEVTAQITPRLRADASLAVRSLLSHPFDSGVDSPSQ